MKYLTYFITGWMHFIAPTNFFGIKTTGRQQLLFAFIMGIVTILGRGIYKFIPIPFGFHTMLFIAAELFVMKKILKELKGFKIALIVWMNILITLTTEALIVFPIIKYYDLSLQRVEFNPLLTFLLMGIGSNMGLIIMALIGKLKHKNDKMAVGG